MNEKGTYLPQDIPAARIVASAVITAAAIQTGKIDAEKSSAIVEYFNELHRQLFGKDPAE